MSFRLDKVSSLIKEEIGLIFLHKIQDPGLSLITVTNVKMSPDLRHAKIYLSIYEKSKRDEAMLKIDSMKKLIRTELASKIQIRFVPELHFYLDDTLDYVEKMEGLFKKIHDNEKNDN